MPIASAVATMSDEKPPILMTIGDLRKTLASLPLPDHYFVELDGDGPCVFWESYGNTFTLSATIPEVVV